MSNTIKKLLITISIIFYSFSVHALSDAASELKSKLEMKETIHASFVQRIISAEGKLLNESVGELSISRPGKFNWQVISPEEESIISNGKTIWYYSPFIEQVTLINFDDAVSDTPFALLAGTNDKQWAQYKVEKTDNTFTVSNPENETQSTTFQFEFDNKNNINKFVVIEELGQRSEFELKHKPLTKPFDNSLFDFKIPEGVEVDDQR